jgi:hypothetical protein
MGSHESWFAVGGGRETKLLSACFRRPGEETCVIDGLVLNSIATLLATAEC